MKLKIVIKFIALISIFLSFGTLWADNLEKQDDRLSSLGHPRMSAPTVLNEGQGADVSPHQASQLTLHEYLQRCVQHIMARRSQLRGVNHAYPLEAENRIKESLWDRFNKGEIFINQQGQWEPGDKEETYARNNLAYVLQRCSKNMASQIFREIGDPYDLTEHINTTHAKQLFATFLISKMGSKMVLPVMTFGLMLYTALIMLY